MPDIRSWSLPFHAIGGGFSGAGGVDTFLSIISSPETAWPAGGVVANPLTGRLYSVSATNRNAATRWLQIWVGATPGSGAPFPTTPLMQFLLPAGSAVTLAREFFGVSGLEFVGPNVQHGSRSQLPTSVYNSVAPVLCGACIAISTTAGSYVAATPSDHDLQGMTGS
jgi:hypothetical protein